MQNYKVKPFSKYVLRTPLFPLSFYFDVLDNCSSEALLVVYQDPFIQEAIRMASPELLLALEKWKKNLKSKDSKHKGLEISLLKYIARITSRCTPFGLFAGCVVGNITSKTSIVVEPKEKFTRHTQFDMHFWVSMLQELTKREGVVNHLTYYPNSSIYAIGDFYRYVEYKYVNTRREYSISALRKSELLETLVLKSKLGATISDMVSFLADDDSEKEEALTYIHQLVDFQFLVSELEATVTGNNEWERVHAILNKIPILDEECKSLKVLQDQLSLLDEKLTPQEETYIAIKNLICLDKFEFDEKYLFQTDLNLTASENTLNSEIPKKVLQALNFLNGIQKKKKSTNHIQFVKAFTERYESRMMSLTTVLDTEIGIGYLQNSAMDDVHELLEQFTFNSKIPNEVNQLWIETDFILERKLQDAILNKTQIISLSENDFPSFDSIWDQAPATFSTMVELIKTGEKEIICIESSGNLSAAKLLGRFCNGNDAIHDLTKEIIEKEAAYYSDKLIAEIVHIPEARTGNVLRRPVFRDHEIVYLSNTSAPKETKIELSDLMIGINNDVIILKSKKHNKEIVPFLSSAHNYTSKSLPIYHFLCDLQSQNTKPVNDFSWGILELHYDFFPRVVYEDVILSKAKWIINKKEIEQFYLMKEDVLVDFFLRWKNEKGIPRYVNWVNFDHTLLLDFDKEIGIQMFLKSIQNFDKIILQEFLFNSESVVKNLDGDNFSNQIILSFYKQKMQ